MDRFDVAVIGTGPAGSSATTFLVRMGCSVILIENFFAVRKALRRFFQSCQLALFEELGVANALLSPEHGKVAAFCISAVSGEEESAKTRLNNIPSFVRGMVVKAVEAFA